MMDRPEWTGLRTYANGYGYNYDGVGYGDSYIIDPAGEIVVRSRRHEEDFIFTDIDTTVTDKAWGVGKSLWSAREFGDRLRQLVEKASHPGADAK